MKGLLYKEYRLGRKTYFMFGALALLFCILGILIFLSMKIGNLRYMTEEDPESATFFSMIFFYLPYVLALFSLTGCNQSVFSDYAAHWMKFSYTLPVRAAKAVGARYLMGGILLLVCFCFGGINAFLVSACSGAAVTGGVIKNILVIQGAAVLIFCLFLPLAMRLKNARTVSAIGGVFAILVYFITMAAFLLEAGNDRGTGNENDQFVELLSRKYEPVRDALLPFLPLLLALAVLVSFWSAVRIYQRREKAC